jgi:hypothetical protein
MRWKLRPGACKGAVVWDSYAVPLHGGANQGGLHMTFRMTLALASISLIALGARAGWEYSATTRMEGSPNSQQMNQSIKGLVDGDKARFDFTSSGNPMMGAGTYLLTKDAGKTVTLVNPKEKTYAAWDMSAMLGMAGAVAKMQAVNPKVEKLLEERGEKLLGYATTHYRFRTSYTMTMTVMGFSSSSEVAREQDIWSAPALKDAAFGFRGLQGGMRAGDEGLEKLIEGEMKKVQGFPLKTISTQTTKDPRGKTTTSKVAMEVTSLKEASPAKDQFEVPSGYTESTLFPKSGPSSGASSGENPFMKMLQERNKRQ